MNNTPYQNEYQSRMICPYGAHNERRSGSRNNSSIGLGHFCECCKAPISGFVINAEMTLRPLSGLSYADNRNQTPS